MVYRLDYDRQPGKYIKKADPPLRHSIEEKLNKIAKEPYNAYSLKGKLKGLWSYHFNFKGIAYRIVYGIYPKEKKVKIVYIDIRENIYKKLRMVK